MEREPEREPDKALAVCRLAIMLIAELVDKDKQQEYFDLVEEAVKEINEQKT